jgi:flagellar protein FliS
MLPSAIAAKYKKVQVNTCSPGELLVMLYDGLFRFLGEAAKAMRDGERARAGEKIDKAHAIVCELTTSLRRQEAPELCDNLMGIYRYSMSLMIKANIQQDPKLIEDVIRILTPLREGFRQVVKGG